MPLRTAITSGHHLGLCLFTKDIVNIFIHFCLKNIHLLLLSVSMCVYMWVPYIWGTHRGQGRVLNPLGLKVTSSCESSNVGASNQIWILCRAASELFHQPHVHSFLTINPYTWSRLGNRGMIHAICFCFILIDFGLKNFFSNSESSQIRHVNVFMV